MADFISKIYKEIGESDINQDVSHYLTTGFLPLDHALSGKYIGGGIPVGRITEIYGGPSAGKTLLATMVLKETQQLGGLAVLLDYEHAFSMGRARTLGLKDDPKQMIYKQPETAEDGFQAIETIGNIVREKDSEVFVTVVVDSVASMVTRKEFETDYGEENMRTRNDLPMVMSSSLKKLAKTVNKTNITLLFLNQIRDKPGVMFGPKTGTPGGNALKFFCSTRVELKKFGKVEDGGILIGENVRAEVVKNKVFEPFRKCEYISHFQNGVNLEISHFEALVKMGKIEQAGAWYKFGDKKFNGKKQVFDALLSDPKMYAEMMGLFKAA